MSRIGGLLTGGLRGDSLVLALGAITAQVILLATMPVLTRMYGPDAFGSAARVLAIVTTLSVIATGRFELAIMLPPSRVRGFSVATLSVLVACAAALVSALVCLMLRQWIAIGSLVWALPLGLVVNGTSNAATYWLLREKSFRSVAVGRVTSSALTAVTQLAFGLAGVTTSGVLILGTVVGPITLLILALAQTANDAELAFQPRDVRDVANQYRRFPLVEAGGALFGTFGTQVPVLMLSAWFPAARIGAFYMAQRLLTAPVSLMGTAVGQVFFQRASERVRAGEGLWPLAWGLFQRLAMIGLVPLLVVLVLGKPLMTLLLGRSWSDTGTFAQLLATAAYSQLTYSPLSTMFAVRQRQGSGLLVHLLIFTVPVVALTIGHVVSASSLFVEVALLGGGLTLLYIGLSAWNLILARSNQFVTGVGSSIEPAAVVE